MTNPTLPGVRPVLRPTLAAAVLLASTRASAEDKAPIPDGTWLLTAGGLAGDAPLCLLKTETSGGRTAVTVVDAPPSARVTVSEVTTAGGRLSFKLSEVRTF